MKKLCSEFTANQIRALFDDCAEAEKNRNYGFVYLASNRAIEIAETLEDCAVKRSLEAIVNPVYKTEDLVCEAWQDYKDNPVAYNETRLALESFSLHCFIKSLALILFATL